MEIIKPWEQPDSFSQFKKILGMVLHRWHWFAIVLFWTLLVAFLINRYESPVYQINAAIITKRFQESNQSVIPVFDNQAMFRNKIEIVQEIPLLKSPRKIGKTLSRINFLITYFVEGNVKTTEVYPGSYFKVKVDSISTKLPYNIPIYVNHVNKNQFELSSSDENWNEIFNNTVCKYGSPCRFNGFSFSLTRIPEQSINENYQYYFIIKDPQQLLNDYRARLNISWRQQGSAILNISMDSELPEKDIDFINEYIEVVIEDGLDEKNAQATNTIKFIDEQMRVIGDSLLNFLVDIDNLKLENREVINGSDYVFEKLYEFDRKKTDLIIENRYYNYLEGYIKKKRYDQVFAPNLIGLNAPLLDQFVGDLISLKMEDQIEKNNDNQLNPLVIREDENTQRLVNNIYESIDGLKKVNIEAISDIDKQTRFYFGSMKELQVEGRELIRLQKLFAYNESLFTTLLQKRTEAQINKASQTSDYEIINNTAYNPKPIYPNKSRNYLIALIFGFGLPFGLIYLLEILNNKILTKDDIRKITNIPIIGHIGHSKLKTNMVIKESPKSLVAESFRNIRANLQYFTMDGDDNKRVYMVTSSISEEGKTFCSINMAQILALSGKKTLLIGADMRKPSLPGYIGTKDMEGLSEVLAGIKIVDEVIVEQGENQPDILLGGAIPPNPAELLGSDKMHSLIKSLKANYEYIVFDTPPIGLVSDAFELLKSVDFSLVVVRQSRTIKSALALVNDLYQEGKIKHLGILFNDVDFQKLHYGYGYKYGYGYNYGYYYQYGHGYYEEKKPKRKFFGKIRSDSK